MKGILFLIIYWFVCIFDTQGQTKIIDLNKGSVNRNIVGSNACVVHITYPQLSQYTQPYAYDYQVDFSGNILCYYGGAYWNYLALWVDSTTTWNSNYGNNYNPGYFISNCSYTNSLNPSMSGVKNILKDSLLLKETNDSLIILTYPSLVSSPFPILDSTYYSPGLKTEYKFFRDGFISVGYLEPNKFTERKYDLSGHLAQQTETNFLTNIDLSTVSYFDYSKGFTTHEWIIDINYFNNEEISYYLDGNFLDLVESPVFSSNPLIYTTDGYYLFSFAQNNITRLEVEHYSKSGIFLWKKSKLIDADNLHKDEVQTVNLLPNGQVAIGVEINKTPTAPTLFGIHYIGSAKLILTDLGFSDFTTDVVQTDELGTNNSIRLNPNPIGISQTVWIDHLNTSSETFVRIIDASGKLILEEKITDNKIPFNRWISGLYHIQIIQGGKLINKKLVVAQ